MATTSLGTTMNRFFRISLLAASVTALVGCEQPSLIDRTQPNYTRKTDLLDGVWYIQETIVDAPKTPQSSAVIGYSGGMEKIRWEIQENMIVGYRSYELVPGADPRVDREKSALGNVVFLDGRPYKGNPVFAYKILSHFDRQRQYNASTGEQTNVLEENSSDRPWYERDYMRVDWSMNLIANADSDCGGKGEHVLGRCRHHGGLFMRYLTDRDQNPNDQAVTEERDASGKLTYFDWTTQVILDPGTLYYPGYGDLPMCFFNPTSDCESVDVRVRTSVLRVDEQVANDYEPLVYNDRIEKKFGFFRQEAYSYSKDYYYTYTGQQFFAMRHNIWQRAHNDDGSVIPVTQRALRPIVYYMTANTPSHLEPAASRHLATAQGMDPNETIEASWDRAFRRAVAVPRGIGADEVPQMFYVCESPVREGSPAACGKPGTFARIGDLRFNTIPYVEQNAGGLLGLGPSSMDPETGRVVHAAANIYGTVLDSWAASSQQTIDVVSGEVPLSKLITGQDIKDYVFANLNPTDPRRPANGPWTSQQGLTSDDPTRPMSSFANVSGRLRTLTDAWRDTSLPLAKQNRKQVVSELIAQNPALQDELINLPEVREAVGALTGNAGFRAKLADDADFYKAVARNMLLGKDPIQEARQELRSSPDPLYGCFYEYSYSDEDYVGLAKRKVALQAERVDVYKAQGKDDATALALAKADVYNTLRREAYRSVTEHEVGHTLGLMHNFIASADALNYHDGYWDLRKETIGVNVGGKRVLAVTPQNLLDASKPNQNQIDSSMYELQYSSIMDYGARVNAQNHGIGKYDEAAILFGYAGGSEPGWVEVFNELRSDYSQPNITVPLDNQARVFTMRGAHVEIPLAQVEHYTPASTFYTDKYHYTTLPFHFADQGASLEAMLDQGISRMGNRSFRKWSEMEQHYAKVEAALKDYNLSYTGLNENDYSRAKLIINAAGGNEIPVEVPYMFCSDYEVGANLMCNLHDQGADVFEMSSKWLERFNQSYVFSNFRRDRISCPDTPYGNLCGFGPLAVAQGKFNRYLANIPNVYQQWLFSIYFLAKYYQLTPEEMDKYYGLGDPIWQNYWTMAVVDSTNLLMQQLAVPEAGYHGKRADGTWEYVPTGDPQNRRLESAAEDALKTRLARPENGGYADLVYVPRGPGRSMYTVYDTAGYDNYNRVNEVGHFWDVYGALLALSTSETNFLGVDRGSDALRYSLPYYTTFNLELAPLFNNYWTQNPTYYAPSLAKQSDGTALIQMPNFVQAQNFVPGFVYPPAPVTPVDGTGAPMVMSKVLPVSTWTARFYAEVLSMANFTANYNLEFANFNQVYRLGSADNLTPSAGFTVVTFEDPFGGGYIYAALKKDNSSDSAAAAMVERASAAATNWRAALASNQPVDGKSATEWAAVVRDNTRTLELMRGLYDVFGRAW